MDDSVFGSMDSAPMNHEMIHIFCPISCVSLGRMANLTHFFRSNFCVILCVTDADEILYAEHPIEKGEKSTPQLTISWCDRLTELLEFELGRSVPLCRPLETNRIYWEIGECKRFGFLHEIYFRRLLNAAQHNMKNAFSNYIRARRWIYHWLLICSVTHDTHIGPSINSYFMPSMYLGRSHEPLTWPAFGAHERKKMGKNWKYRTNQLKLNGLAHGINPSEFDAVNTHFSNIVVAACQAATVPLWPQWPEWPLSHSASDHIPSSGHTMEIHFKKRRKESN